MIVLQYDRDTINLVQSLSPDTFYSRPLYLFSLSRVVWKIVLNFKKLCCEFRNCIGLLDQFPSLTRDRDGMLRVLREPASFGRIADTQHECGHSTEMTGEFYASLRRAGNKQKSGYSTTGIRTVLRFG